MYKNKIVLICLSLLTLNGYASTPIILKTYKEVLTAMTLGHQLKMVTDLSKCSVANLHYPNMRDALVTVNLDHLIAYRDRVDGHDRENIYTSTNAIENTKLFGLTRMLATTYLSDDGSVNLTTLFLGLEQNNKLAEFSFSCKISDGKDTNASKFFDLSV